MDSSLVYTAGAVWLATLLAYYLLSRKPLFSMPVGGLAVALVFVTLYPWITGWVNDKAALDFAAFDQSRRCILDTVGAASAHVSFAAEVIMTAGAVLGILTLGVSAAIASVIADAIITAFASLVHGVVVYLSYAESVLGTVTAAISLAPSFTALAAPLIAVLMPDRRGAAVAAAVASIPAAMSAVFLLTPPLTPYDACYAGKTNMALNGAVNVKADGPVTLLFNGTAYGGWNVTVVYSPVTSGKLYLPAGNYTAYAVWSFIPIPLGAVHIPPTNATVANATIANRTAYLPDIPVAINVTIPIAAYVDEWAFASDVKPNKVGYEGIYKTYTYVLDYYCYGTSAECPGFTKTFSALGQIERASVRVLESQNVYYSASTSVVNASSVGEELWEKICYIGEIPGGYCPAYRQPKRAEATISASPVVEYECVQYVNGTCAQQQEKRLERRLKAEVVFYARPTASPALGGILHDGERTYDWVVGLLALAFPPFSLAGAIAKYFGGMIAWLTAVLIPYLISLIYAEMAVILGVGGVLALVGAGNVFWQWLHTGLLSKIHWRFDPIRTPLRLLRITARHMGRGESAVETATVQTTREVVKEVVAGTVKRASMAWFGVAAAVRGFEMFHYGEPWLWPAHAAQAAALYKHLRSTDYTLTRREAAARALFYTLTPAGHEYARRLDTYIYWAQNIAYLRLDAFAALAAKQFREAYLHNLELTGSRRLAVELTLAFRRPATATDAAFYVLGHGGPRPRNYLTPVVEELARRLGVTPEEAARRWMAVYGYDYDRVREALSKLGIELSPQGVISLPLHEASEYIASRLIAMGEYGLAAAFKWTDAVREFEARYAPLDALARGDAEAWRRYVVAVAREWEPLRVETRPSDVVEAVDALRWIASRLVYRGGEYHLDYVGLIPLEKAAAAFPEVWEKITTLVGDILPEDLVMRALSKPETAYAIYALAQEEPKVEALVRLYSKREPWELVEEAARLQRLGRADLAAVLGDAAELAAAARMAQALPFEPSLDVYDLARAMALGLTEENARYVLERYGSPALQWLEDARVPREGEEPSRLVDYLLTSYYAREELERAAAELEEILGWKPSPEQVEAVRDLYVKVEYPELAKAFEERKAMVEEVVERVEKYGWAEAPGYVDVAGYETIQVADGYIIAKPELAERYRRAVEELEEKGEIQVDDWFVAYALHRAGYQVEPADRGLWTARMETDRELSVAPAEAELASVTSSAAIGGVGEAHGAGEAEAVEAASAVLRAAAEEAWERWGDFGREYVERVGPRGLEALERAEALQRLAAEYGASLALEDAVRYVEQYGPSAANAWAEDYAAGRYGEWARGYVSVMGWKALETLQHYEAAEEEARRLGIEMDREALLKIAERWGEEAPDRVVEIAAQRVAREYGLRGLEEEIAEDIKRYGLYAADKARKAAQADDPKEAYRRLE
ncbi:hypothetical protein [Pyrobaculum arsenaticum]|uniref:Uncharacterized protein n=1 Tax=Pyrobaculum arsenaticum TaxID=121277 RepID=A0A7L4PBM8_9CREN|nr:hypothetical protein [Pyrobaculum arsenaticum]NYR15266.1 hypothetical protein [Pyrobaculum arsenaticum]